MDQMIIDKQRENKTKKCTHYVSVMVNIIGSLSAHIMAIYQVKNAHDNSGNRENSVKIDFFPRVEKNVKEDNS